MIWDVELCGGDEGVYVTQWFAVSFLCAVQRRCGVMLGSQRLWPSDACCFVFEGGRCVMRGGAEMFFVADEVFCFGVQVGDGSTTSRFTPVSVSGLGSGVAMIAVGGVRFCCDCFWAICCVGAERVHLIDCALVIVWHEDV